MFDTGRVEALGTSDAHLPAAHRGRDAGAVLGPMV
jgi:hypothetical protein